MQVIEQTPAFADHIRVLLDRPLFYAQFAFRFMTMCGSLVALGAYIYVVILAKKESKVSNWLNVLLYSVFSSYDHLGKNFSIVDYLYYAFHAVSVRQVLHIYV